MSETVTIVVPDHPNGTVVIEAADYDPAVHTLAEAAPEPEPEPAADAEAASAHGKPARKRG